MFNAISSEWCKYRHSSIPRFLLLAPLVIAAAVYIYSAPYRLDATAWLTVFNVGNEFWSGLWIPIGWGLIAGLAGEMEASSDGWRALRMREVQPALLYLAKAAVLALYGLLFSLWFWALLYVVGRLLEVPHPFPFFLFASALAVNWLGTLPWVWTALWLAEGAGWTVSIGSGAIGTLVSSILGGATTLGNNIWPFIPWTWPMRLIYLDYGMLTSSLQGVVSSTLFWLILIAAIGTGCIILILGMWWFQHRDLM